MYFADQPNVKVIFFKKSKKNFFLHFVKKSDANMTTVDENAKNPILRIFFANDQQGVQWTAMPDYQRTNCFG